MPEFEDIDFDDYSYDFSDKMAKLREIRSQYRLSLVREEAQRRAVVAGLKDIYPQLENKDLVKLSYAVVLLPKEEHITINKEKVKVEDLQFMLAESIEHISSGTDSRQEYFSWFEDCSEIITKMNDGYVSDADLKQRNDWIENSYVRESEIMVCLALYKSSSYYLAAERYEMLYNKLVKLRQIRSAISESTQSISDEKKDKEFRKRFKEKVDEYLRAMSLFAAGSVMWNLSKNELKRLGIYHGDDHDLAQEYEYFYSICEPRNKAKALPAKSVVENNYSSLSAATENIALPEVVSKAEAVMQTSVLPEYVEQVNALPAHENLALPAHQDKMMALPPHEQYAFDEDLKYSFMQCLNRRYFEGLSYAEEMRLVQKHENREQVEERISILRERCNENYRAYGKIFDAQKYRAALKNSNML